MLPEADYQALKGFLRYFSEKHMPVGNLPKDLWPIALIEKLETTSQSKAERSLLMGINDIIEMSARWLPPQVLDLDKELTGAGLPSLSALRKKYSKAYQKTLARGRIVSEVEYYFLKGVADSNVVENAKEKAQVESLLREYLQRVQAGRHRRA